MGTPYLGEIRAFSFGFAPKGWAMCNGQLLPINQYQALFALLGTTYGGNGTINFALPNLQGSVPVHAGGGFVQGQVGGEASHALLISEIPAHTHSITGSTIAADNNAPPNNVWAESKNTYDATPTVSMYPGSIATAGGGQPHSNQQPYLVLNFCIAMVGIFPSRN